MSARSYRLPFRWCVIALSLLAAPVTSAQQVGPGLDTPLARAPETIEVEIDLDAEAQRFAGTIPRYDATAENVRRYGDGSEDVDCHASALRVAATALERARQARGMASVGKFYFELAKIGLQAYGLDHLADAADLIEKAYSADSAGDFAQGVGEFLAGKIGGAAVKSDLAQKLNLSGDVAEEIIAGKAAELLYAELMKDVVRSWTESVDSPCDGLTVTIAVNGGAGGPTLTFYVYGDCACSTPKHQPESRRLSTFGVFGTAKLVPHSRYANGKLQISFSPEDPVYEVVAQCGCGTKTALLDRSGTSLPLDDALTLPGFAVSYDTTEWCSYGGGQSGIPIGSPATTGGGETPGGDEPSSAGGTPIGAPIPTGDPTGTFSPPEWVTTGRSGDPTPGSTPRTPPTQPPQEDDPDDPRDLPPPNAVPVKATQAVLLAGGTTQIAAMKGARVKLDLGPEPELPLAGAPRLDDGFADPPVQGVTDANGLASLALPAGTTLPAAYRGAAVEVDLTPAASKLVYLKRGADPRSALDAGLAGLIGRSFAVKDTLVVPLFFQREELGRVEKLIAKSPGVLESETNYCRDEQALPNDPYFSSQKSWKQPYADQWAIQRVGFTQGDGSAWSLVGPDATPVVVAVVDTGLDWNHADVERASLWTHPREIPGNGRDDDGNGYVDDVIGWDFQGQDPKPFDRDGHGTFVAGVIAAGWNNGVGIAGINPHARLMTLRALNDFGHTRASYLAEAIVYAADNGARVINVSVGGKNLTRAENLAIEHAHERGALVVVAAGNEGVDVAGFGPAGAKHALAVASTGLDDKRAPFSNWGAGIALAAPGMDVLSLRARRTDFMRDLPDVKYVPGEAFVGSDRRYYRTSGTSFSAPIVSGVASLVLAKRPELSVDALRELLLQTARDVDVPGQDQHTGFGIVDARAALAAEPGLRLATEILDVVVVERDGKQMVQVNGSAGADKLRRRWIEIGSGDAPTRWQKIGGDASDPVESGVLGLIPAEALRGATTWTIRSVVEHESGQTREVRFRLDLG